MSRSLCYRCGGQCARLKALHAAEFEHRAAERRWLRAAERVRLVRAEFYDHELDERSVA